VTKSRYQKLVRVTSSNECREHKCVDLRAEKSFQHTGLQFKPMQISPVRTKFIIPLLPTNFIKTANIKSKNLHAVYLKLYKPELYNSKNFNVC